MTDYRQDYVGEFLGLKCAPDVLGVCNPLGNKAKKEISEAMSVSKYLRRIVLGSPYLHGVYDFCAGNALVSVLAAHLLPVSYAIAVDKRYRDRKWSKVRRFAYMEMDINDIDPLYIGKGHSIIPIIVSMHPCGRLAERVIEIYNESNTKHLILCPCCTGQFKQDIPQLFQDRIGKYESWCWYLAQQCTGRVNITQDKRNLSPKNIVITATKECA